MIEFAWANVQKIGMAELYVTDRLPITVFAVRLLEFTGGLDGRGFALRRIQAQAACA